MTRTATSLPKNGACLPKERLLPPRWFLDTHLKWGTQIRHLKGTANHKLKKRWKHQSRRQNSWPSKSPPTKLRQETLRPEAQVIKELGLLTAVDEPYCKATTRVLIESLTKTSFRSLRRVRKSNRTVPRQARRFYLVKMKTRPRPSFSTSQEAITKICKKCKFRAVLNCNTRDRSSREYQLFSLKARSLPKSRDRPFRM